MKGFFGDIFDFNRDGKLDSFEKAAGGIIHSVVKQAWNQTFLLFLIEGILIAVTIGTGMIEMLVDAALSRLAGF